MLKKWNSGRENGLKKITIYLEDILFGFEVDTLEIALREQEDLVDKVFIVESFLTHKSVKTWIVN